MDNVYGLQNYITPQPDPNDPSQMMSQMSPEQAQLLDNLRQVQSINKRAVQATDAIAQPDGTLKPVQKPAANQPPVSFQAQVPISDDQKSNAIADKYQALSDQAMNEQRSGLSQLENNLNDVKQAGNVISNTNWQPLLSLYDSWNKTNTASGYQQPESDQARKEKILSLESAIQTQRGVMSKDELSNLKSQLDAYKAQTMNPLQQAEITKNLAQAQYYKNGGNPASRQEDRLAQQAHNGVLRRLDHNKSLQTKLNQIQGLDNASKIIEEAPVVSPTIFNDYQQAVVSAVQRGNSGIGERAERYLTSAGINGAKIQQFLSGKPVDIGKDNALLKAMQGFAKTERGNIEKQYGGIVDTVTTGQEHIYNKHPEMKKSLSNAVKAYKGLAADGQPAGGQAPAIGDVIDGHTYQGGDPSDPGSWEAE